MNSKVAIAVVVVAILVIGGAGAIIYSNMEKGYEYDVSKGWYSWDPIVSNNASTSKFANHPLFADQVEVLYKDIYGTTPDYSKYKMSDVPNDFMKPESYIKSETDTTVTVISHLRVDSKSGEYEEIDVTLSKNTDLMLTQGSQLSLIYALLCTKYDKVTAEAMLWEHVYGLDKSAFAGGSADVNKTMGITVPSTVAKVESTYSLIKNLDTYTGYVEDATADGSDLVIITGVIGDSSADMKKTFFPMLEAATPGNAYYIGLFSPSIESVLGNIQMLGAIFGLEDEAKTFVNEMRFKFYVMDQESEKLNKHYSAYMESTGVTGAGTKTIIGNIMSEILNLENICTQEQWEKQSEEYIIEKTPKVIIFYDSDKRTMDQKMRVPEEVAA